MGLSKAFVALRQDQRPSQRREDGKGIDLERNESLDQGSARRCGYVRTLRQMWFSPWSICGQPPGPMSTPKYLARSLICICRTTGTWVPTHSESCGIAKFPSWIQWHFLSLRDMPVTGSTVVKASATSGRDSRREAVARAKSFCSERKDSMKENPQPVRCAREVAQLSFDNAHSLASKSTTIQ